MALAPEDFPQMWQRPGYEELIGILESLELSPPVWNHRQQRSDIIAQQESLATQRKAEVTRYLSSIIKSPLAWIDDYDKQEALWELASKRMSERCGRTAMGEVTRRWPFEGDGAACEPFELIIKEPALTGDSLGFKTWGSSYVLSSYLPRLAATSLFKIFDETLGQPPPTVLELGSGTGLLGVAAAAFWQTHVILSDLPNIVPNLKDNMEKNKDLVESRGGSMSVVLVADPLYDDDHPALLASAICQNLALGSESRAVVMVPMRDETTRGLLESFKQAMLDLETPLFLEEEKKLDGEDDWGEDEDEGQVECWLGVFSRGGSPLTA
ncbi:protein-lysine N-methyltransferase EFM2 [Trichoderma asperellum]|uniref:Protein-lysine N-methyltransferase EFM2 n=1 Tax=Trichoderma asperellum TaxID=101201 RepID=A0A6V8QVQ2_TRIAP|nr:protein-lysine N-methyltransferase EFM2 [Trichoderma asperellum]